MATVEHETPLLEPGQRLARAEFLRRWDAMPDLKRAELLRGVVHMPSPVSLPHMRMTSRLTTWLGIYLARTPGCDAGSDGTWLMPDDDAPQPDLALWILPEHGGQSAVAGNYPTGAPEFLAEVSLASTRTDLGVKFDIYRAAGVREYLVIVLDPPEIRWHRRVANQLELLPPGSAGIWRSEVFPGLWLDGAALLRLDLARVEEVLRQGLATQEHADFVARLRGAAESTSP